MLWIILPVLINVAFFTLLERKILGLRQLRKGPNKVSVGGILQPMRDAVKLFMKEFFRPFKAKLFLFTASPSLGLFIILLIWRLFADYWGFQRFSYSISLFLVFLGINIYPLFFCGWCSNRKYALLGATRGISQSISYEISLALILLAFLCLSRRIQLSGVFFRNMEISYVFVAAPLVYLWLVCCVAETNRSPFDFAEGERELVSGFNIEYGAGGFALIFIAEYARILFLSYLTGLLLGASHFSSEIQVLGIIILGRIWVWLRCTYPRYRYDKLMILAWKRFLPLTLSGTLFYMRVSSF